MDDLDAVRASLGDCQRCPLAQTRLSLVFGSGPARADLMFVGEAPGAAEDFKGEPFVGKSGQLLARLLRENGWSREDVFIHNTICCRPPNNREPTAEETAACRPFLLQKIAAVRPLVIITLGKSAVRALLETRAPMGQLRGKPTKFHNSIVIPTYHPSFILRGNWKVLDTMRADFALANAALLDKGVIPPGWRA